MEQNTSVGKTAAVRPVWRWDELGYALGPCLTQPHDHQTSRKGSLEAWGARGISVDTRTLVPGDIFVALEGRHHHGMAFVEQAVAKGASAVMLGQDKGSVGDGTVPFIPVSDPWQALQYLAKHARDRFQGRLLALTGSVGKTSVKEGMAQIMRGWGETFATPGNFNNHLGVALSLCALPEWAQYGIFELGMNAPGEIGPLAEQVRAHVALVTHVVYQHGAAFESFDCIVQEKGSIFASKGLEQGLVPCDASYEAALRQCGPATLPWTTFGAQARADITLRHALMDENGQTTQLVMGIGATQHSVHWPMIGQHTYHNALAMVAGSLALGAPLEVVLAQLPGVMPAPGRGQILPIQGIDVIDESYNAAPAAMKAAIATLAQRSCRGRCYVVLGEMKELGDQTERWHQEVLDALGQHQWQHVWLCGQGFASPVTQAKAQGGARHLTWSHRIDEVVDDIISTLRPGDMILVKGSRSTRTETVIEALRHRYGSEMGGRTQSPECVDI